ncbi:MAG TPA: hypothetical protein VFT70_01000 [Nocardioides sp.]|nr:hypothetical protein [Nocardioides sp.]
MSEEQHTREHTKQPREELADEIAEAPDQQDVDMEPEDHVNRPDQPDFDPAERRPYVDPDAELPTEHDA